MNPKYSGHSHFIKKEKSVISKAQKLDAIGETEAITTRWFIDFERSRMNSSGRKAIDFFARKEIV